MATHSIQGVRISGIASAVPSTRHSVHAFDKTFGSEEVAKIAQSTGVEYRHISERLCCSDLCFAAARRLLQELEWDPGSVDGLICVSQSPDFPMVPATSCTLQHRLGLPKQCACFDVALGCSGHVYGLWVAASLIGSGGLSRVLLLAGDISTRFCSPLDRSTALIFGDAGSATALSGDPSAPPLAFSLGTDGSGWDKLIIRSNSLRSSRFPQTPERNTRKPAENGNIRSDEDLYMDGAEVFAFTIREVSPLVDSALKVAGWSKEEVDYFVFHQANRFMLKHLAKMMRLPPAKVPLSLKDYGNTSSASIPITINSQIAGEITTKPLKLLMTGFGVGYSWGACVTECGPIVSPPVILVDESEAWQC